MGFNSGFKGLMTSSWNSRLIVWVFLVSVVAFFHAFPTYKKLQLSLYINKFHAFITLVIVGSEWSATALGYFTFGERTCSTQLGPRPNLDSLEKSLLPMLRTKPQFHCHPTCNLVCLFQNGVQSTMLLLNQQRPLTF